MKQKLLLEHLSWPEIKQDLEDGFFRVIIPVASMEQHGYHLPENTDTVLGEACALMVAEKLGKTLVAPVIRPGISPHHMRLPGTVTLRMETFRMLVRDYVDCYIHHGFTEIVFLAAHGGNVKPCEEVTAEVLSDPEIQKSGVKLFTVKDIPSPEELRELERIHGLPVGTNGGHADERETSEMLSVVPELVTMEKAAKGWCDPLTPELLEQFFTQGVTSLTEVGSIGDPRYATAERGLWYRETAASALAKEILEKSKD